MKTLRRSLCLAGILTVNQLILTDSQTPPTLQEQNEQMQQQPQRQTLRSVPRTENGKSSSPTFKQTAPTTVKKDDDHYEKKEHERQERRRRDLRERHIEQRARIQRILQEQDTIDVIVTLDETVMGLESAAAASDFERTHAKVMTVTISQYEDMQDDPTILLVEVDALVYPQQQQPEDVVFSLQSFNGKEQTPWNVAAVLQNDFNAIPSTPQPMIFTNSAATRSSSSMSASCSVKVCVIDSGVLADHPDLVRMCV
jgi:hypothetical protein